MSTRTIKEIIIHCTATEEGKNFTVADIDEWHRKRGWRCIGYHYVVYLDGTIAYGRKPTEIGAHCNGHNSNSIGVCYVGGLRNGKPADTRTPQQKIALLRLLSNLKTMYPNAKIFGHRDFAPKACPCFDARAEYREL